MPGALKVVHVSPFKRRQLPHLAGAEPPKPTQVIHPALIEICGPVQHKRFGRQHRLIKHQVERLLRAGARLSRADFIVKLGENQVGRGRIAIAVPKRILKSAVDRNRVKRVIREAFRQHPVRGLPVDILVTLRSDVQVEPGGIKTRSHKSQLRRGMLTQLLGDVARRFGVAA